MSDQKPEAAAAAPSSTALAIIVPRSFEEAMQMATFFAKSQLLPEKLQQKPADVALTLMAGVELGVGPIAALRGIHIIEGRPSLSADLMVAVVRRSGLCVYFREIESNDKIAIYETLRRGDRDAVRASFTIEDAKTAKLVDRGRDPSQNNWNKYPSAMLRARAKSILVRKAYEDLLFGCYTPDELGSDSAIEMIETGPGHYSPPPKPASEAQTTTRGSNAATVATRGSNAATEERTASTDPDGDAEALARRFDAVESAIIASVSLEQLKVAKSMGARLPAGEERKRLSRLANEKEQELSGIKVEAADGQ